MFSEYNDAFPTSVVLFFCNEVKLSAMLLSNYLRHELRWRIDSFRAAHLSPRMLQLDVDYDVVFRSSAPGSIRDIVLDELESRYLLAGYQDGSIVLFDVESYTLSDLQQHVCDQLARVDKLPKAFSLHHQRAAGLSPSVCIQWYPVDSGIFFTASLDKTVKLWDTNRLECVDVVELSASISWIALSDSSTTHNLVAAALRRAEHSCAVLVDPVIGAPALTLIGGHSPTGSSTIAWSPRSAHTVITGGHDGRILYWDIRSPGKPFCSLDKYVNPDAPTTCSPEAVAHTGPVLSLAFSVDGLHLISWGGAGSDENAFCLRMWSSGPDDYTTTSLDHVTQCRPRLRPVNFGTIYLNSGATENLTRSVGQLPVAESRSSHSMVRALGLNDARIRHTHTPVRMAAVEGVAGDAWGAQSIYLYVPCRSRLLMALAAKQDAPSRMVNRHYDRASCLISSIWRTHFFSRLIHPHTQSVRACVWNKRKEELYSCGMDGNLFVWPLYLSMSSADDLG
ncbi:DNA excision repair protein ERCC-8 [Paragonimus westermani]|uniref:DNA excision repair protein ERCC-8 n=1 Tax=Paragonimus westermani TaxID=34504 RepID=A0A8T0D226_9TREM|nr:DNA excision repair protein ERCC-8 [Paragonimus westermani]